LGSAPLTAIRVISCLLYNPDLLFCQPVKLVDQGVYLAIGGFYFTGRKVCSKERLLLITVDNKKKITIRISDYFML
jgi:hypothetical protein